MLSDTILPNLSEYDVTFEDETVLIGPNENIVMTIGLFQIKIYTILHYLYLY